MRRWVAFALLVVVVVAAAVVDENDVADTHTHRHTVTLQTKDKGAENNKAPAHQPKAPVDGSNLVVAGAFARPASDPDIPRPGRVAHATTVARAPPALPA